MWLSTLTAPQGKHDQQFRASSALPATGALQMRLRSNWHHFCMPHRLLFLFHVKVLLYGLCSSGLQLLSQHRAMSQGLYRPACNSSPVSYDWHTCRPGGHALVHKEVSFVAGTLTSAPFDYAQSSPAAIVLKCLLLKIWLMQTCTHVSHAHGKDWNMRATLWQAYEPSQIAALASISMCCTVSRNKHALEECAAVDGWMEGCSFEQ